MKLYLTSIAADNLPARRLLERGLPDMPTYRDQPKVDDGASDLLQDVFGKDKNPSRLVYGVASLPLGTPVELEVIFEVSAR